LLAGAFTVAATGAAAGATEASQSLPGAVSRLADLPLDQLLDVEISGASNRLQAVADAPASVTVLTAQDFRTYGWRTLGAALRAVRGFYLGSDRVYDFIGINGFQTPADYNSRILLLIDGARLNEPIYDSAPVAEDFPLDVELIDHVEIIRGPSSSVYGANALFGVINVVTRPIAELDGASAGAEAGPYGTRRARVGAASAPADGARWLLEASRERSDGETLSFPDEPYTAGRPVAGTDYKRITRLYGRLESGRESLVAYYGCRESGLPGGQYGTIPGPGNLARDTYYGLNANWLAQTLLGEMQARAGARRYRYDGNYLYPATPNVDYSYAQALSAELRFVARAAGIHTITYGADWQRNTTARYMNYDVSPYVVYTDLDHGGRRAGLFVQDDVRASERVSISAGARFDSDTGEDPRISPRLGLILRPLEATVVKLLYGSAFRPPNLNELAYPTPNVALRPETIHATELALESAPAPDLRLEASIYRYRMQDLIRSFTDSATGNTTYTNLPQAHAAGAQFEIERRWSARLRSGASIAWQRLTDSSGVENNNTPDRIFKLNAHASLPGGIDAGWETQVQSAKQDTVSVTPGYSVSNLTLSTPVPPHGWAWTAGVYNVFDREYTEVANLAPPREQLVQPRRAWRVGAEYRF
jgi:iron complex outermembrane receptor protein